MKRRDALLALLLAGCLSVSGASAQDASSTLRRSLSQRGSPAPWVRPGAVALRAILGTGQVDVVEEDERTIELTWRMLFNERHEVGWLNEAGEFQTRAAAGAEMVNVTFFPGDVFDLAVRDTASGRVYLASSAPSRIVPLDSVPPALALEPKPAQPYARQWVVTFRGTSVVVAIDASWALGRRQRGGSGLERIRYSGKR
jgi:hypothetical protein